MKSAKTGSVIHSGARDMIFSRIQNAVDRGASVVMGREPDGCIVKPTVLRDVEDGMSVVHEETFGPVVSIMKFADTDDVVDRANRRGGLSAYVYKKDVENGMGMLSRINAVMVWLNSVRISSGEMDFSEIERTGLGRERGCDA